MIKSRLIFCVVIGLYALLGVATVHAEQYADLTAIHLQLRLFDAISESNPNYEDTLKAIAAVERPRQEARLAALAERNAQNPRIAALVDSLLTSPGYTLYYRQFKNVTPDIHRRIFFALPYRGIPSPADIGQKQLELFHHRDSLAALVEIVSTVDIAEAVLIARRWSPPGDSSVPTTYYILDGNGDAFGGRDGVCFDLYGVVLSPRPVAGRYENLAAISTADIEAVLAHEFQHVFAWRYLYRDVPEFDRWQDSWEDILIRGLVSEGVAMQCNPPSGFKRAVFGDTTIVRFWLREVERVIGQIRDDQISEDSVRAWRDRSYHETAQRLLSGYIMRTFSKDDWETVWREHTDRPDCMHALGWWMVSHIVAAPGGQDAAVQLLIAPHDLFRAYNAIMTDSVLKIAL
jgi:hypothetical protein